MCYDDHMYCDVCRRHERSCWCLIGDTWTPERLAEELAEAKERGLCEGHGYLVVVAALYKQGMDWARRAGLDRHEFRVAIKSDQLWGIHEPVEVVVHSYPDMDSSAEVRILRAAGVKVWDVP